MFLSEKMVLCRGTSETTGDQIRLQATTEDHRRPQESWILSCKFNFYVAAYLFIMPLRMHFELATSYGRRIIRYTQGEVTSQNLWSLYDRHVVGITWHDVWSYKKLSYRRVTARCVLSVVILPIATQQYRNYLYTSPDLTDGMKLEV